MDKYEAMFIIKPDLSEEERKTLFGQISDVVSKNNGSVSASAVWAERRKLFFPINKCREGLYFLMNFSILPLAIDALRQAYKLNENILRVLITKAE
ncbi:MAG: 30S ribosomal protein S6 [Candidatus Omnitrophota bacterium]